MNVSDTLMLYMMTRNQQIPLNLSAVTTQETANLMEALTESIPEVHKTDGHKVDMFV